MYNLNLTSFNIRVPDDEIPVWLYICFRASCGAKGVITPEFLRMIGQDNFEANVYLNKISRIASKSKGFKSKSMRSIANFPSPDNLLSTAKLRYLNNRLGTELTLKDLIKLKIHTDFLTLYRYNTIQPPAKRTEFYNTLSKSGLAFLSAYNDYLIVRNVTNNKRIQRYTNVDIFESNMDGVDKYKFYVIPTKIDPLSSKPVVLNMAEGTFDILSVYFNLDIDREYENQIYSAVAGSAYESTIAHLIRQYGLVDIILNIFSDDNIPLSTYEELYRKIKVYTNSIEMKIYYNKIGKDFGVSRDKIQLQENHIGFTV